MTTWQDQQPQSRRALRESERAHDQATMSDAEQESPEETDFGQQIWANQPTAAPQEASQERPVASAPEEPLRRPRRSGSERPEPEQSAAESQAYRLRDFSPESRGASFSSTHSAPWTPPAPGSEDLSYQTSGRGLSPQPTDASAPVFLPPMVVTPLEVPSATSTAPATEPATQPIASDEPVEHTLTRRELRNLRSAADRLTARPAEASEATATPPAPSVSSSAVPPQPANADELAAAMAEFDRMFQARQSQGQEIPALVEPRTSSTGPAAPAAGSPPVAQSPVAAPPAAAPPATASPAPMQHEESMPPQHTAGRRAAPSAPDEAPAEPLREVVTAPEVYAAPEGHWSTQAAMDDARDSSVRPHKRDIGSSDAITTSALILPDFPSSMPVTGPVSGTGEILMTGSISLPRSMGVRGIHPSRYDRSDIDDIIDAGDREDAAPDSAPVRAVRAVSTYTSSQGIINSKRPKGNNLPMVLSITAGVMMVGVVALFVVGMIFKIF